jgi:putative transposase
MQRSGKGEDFYATSRSRLTMPYRSNEAKQSQSFIALENLTGIRERTNQKPRNKTERRRSNSWAFYQLRTFLEYKGMKEGVEVIAVHPAYTSQTGHCCLHIWQRNNKSFKCNHKTCGWIGDADKNGSLMIALLGLSVRRPRGSNWLACPVDLGLQKAHDYATLKSWEPYMRRSYE